MATHVLSEVLRHSRATKGDRLVIIVLADEAGKETREARCSVDLIAAYARLSIRAVQYALRRLVEMGEVSIISNQVGGRERASVYRINELPVGLKGANSAPFSDADDALKGANSAPFTSPKRVQVATEKGASRDTKRVQVATHTYSGNYSVNPIHGALARAACVDDEFEKTWPDYPARAGSNPKGPARRQWRARHKEGHSVEQLRAGLERYRRYCEKRGIVGSDHVMQARRFFGPDKEFLHSWGKQAPPRAPPPKATAPPIDPAAAKRRERDAYNREMVRLGRPGMQVDLETGEPITRGST